MADYVKLPDEDKEPKGKKPTYKLSFKKIILLVIGLFILSSIISSISYSLAPKIGVVPISGTIMTEEETSLLSGSSISSRKIASQLYSLRDDTSVQSILLDINSPGGSAVATEEIAKAVKNVSHTKPVYALVNDVGASGAFWISVTANKSYASPMSTLGSIGVTSATLSYEEFIDKHNITYRKLTAGEYKDLGSPFREMTDKEKEMMQGMLDELHSRFINHTAESRNMSVEEVKKYADGRVFLGSTAHKAGFIDELGYYPDAIKELKNGSNIMVVNYGPKSPLSSLLGVDSPTLYPKTYSPMWFIS